MDLDGMISISAESRNETVSNIPGPGRLLGKVYAKLGRNFEAAMSLIARSMRRGPIPTASKIEQLMLTLKDPDHPLFSGNKLVAVKKLEKELEQNCRLLVKHTRYVSR